MQYGGLMIQVKGSDGKNPTAGKYSVSTLTEDTENPGTYIATIKSKLADTLTLKPLYNGEVVLSMSDTVTFAPEAFKDLVVNGKTFNITDGFPNIGFNSTAGQIAQFNLNTPSGKTVSDYTWTSNQGWVTVNAGVVSFTGIPDSSTNTVKITATANTAGATLQYVFTINTWFIVDVSNVVANTKTWSETNAYCATQGAAMPSKSQLTSGQGVRDMKSLWGHWGNLIWPTSDRWMRTTDVEGGGHTIVESSSGNTKAYNDGSGNVWAACYKSL